MQLFRLFLLPFSFVYCAVSTIRNKLFDLGILKSQSYKLPLISIGNITVGGTGKTPVTELLLHTLGDKYKCATLSRGYGRKTKGVILAGDADNCNTIGDEPMQMKLKFPGITVVVAEKRVEGMARLLNRDEKPDVVLLDDAFQHRYVKPGLSILVIDYNRPPWKDFCLPAGNLREPISALKRSDIILVNKCPHNLSKEKAELIRNKLRPASHQKLFFSVIQYEEPLCLGNTNNKLSFRDKLAENVEALVAVAGIGNPQPFYESLRQFGVPLRTLSFRDHHNFSQADLKKIEEEGCNKNTRRPEVITTEKDAVRMISSGFLTESLKERLWYLPIRIEVLFDQQDIFEKIITDYVESHY